MGTAAPPRIAFLAGGLWKGGAEKQLWYMVRALRSAGGEVRVYTLTEGGFYRSWLEQLGVPVVWVGRRAHPLFRLQRLARELREYRPDVLQAVHSYTNLYVALLARWCGAAAIGSVRNDVHHEIEANGAWGSWLIRVPPALLVNSFAARTNALALGIAAERVHVLGNVIDLPPGDDPPRSAVSPGRELIVLGIGRLVPSKRWDLFLTAVARAREAGTPVHGRLVGDGPERARLAEVARALSLGPDALTFAGEVADVRPELAGAHLLLHTSEHEGFPNVILEAMAAGLPVVATPAGDAAMLVEDDRTGYLVPFGDVEAMARRLSVLAGSSTLRERLGAAGRARVRSRHGPQGLGARLLRLYEDVGRQQRRAGPVRRVAADGSSV